MRHLITAGLLGGAALGGALLGSVGLAGGAGMPMAPAAAPASTPLRATAALRDAAGQVLGTATF